MARTPTCHPDRPHRARGLCGECYWRAKAAGTLGEHARTIPAEPNRCHCGRVIAAKARACAAHFRPPLRWVCECPDPVLDSIGMCLRCGRKPLDLIQAGAARYRAMMANSRA